MLESIPFAPRTSVEQVEEGTELAPKFDANGCLPCITRHAETGEILMFALMNEEALRLTLTTRLAHYWSRSRQKLWKKGETSGMFQNVCGGFDDLIQLCLTVQKTRSDVLLIELNGTADPIPLLESFTLLESRLRFRPRWQIAIIDASQFGLRGQYDELELEQLQTASHYVLTHTDRVSKSRRDDVLLNIRHFNPHASRTTAARVSTHLASTVADATPTILFSENNSATDKYKPHTRSQAHHLSHSFTGCQLLLPAQVRTTEMTSFLRALPETVIRAKSLVTTPEKPNCRQLFERVGTDFLPEPIEVPISEKVPPSAICIGPKLDPNALLQIAIRHFGPSVTFPDHD